MHCCPPETSSWWKHEPRALEILMNTPDVTKAQQSERDRCIAAQVLAFAADPLLRWMLPDSQTFQNVFPKV